MKNYEADFSKGRAMDMGDYISIFKRELAKLVAVDDATMKHLEAMAEQARDNGYSPARFAQIVSQNQN